MNAMTFNTLPAIALAQMVRGHGCFTTITADGAIHAVFSAHGIHRLIPRALRRAHVAGRLSGLPLTFEVL